MPQPRTTKLVECLPLRHERAALLEMGSTTAVRQQIWESRWESVVENFFQDLRLSVRFLLLKRPGFTCVALLSLALGIGANAAIFTLVRQVLMQELPVRDPQLLVSFGNQQSGGIGGGIDTGQSGLFPWYFARELELHPGPFQGIAAFCSFSNKAVVRRAFSLESAAGQIVHCSGESRFRQLLSGARGIGTDRANHSACRCRGAWKRARAGPQLLILEFVLCI